MIEEIAALDRIRQIYDGVEFMLSGDYHFWLQRGSLEVEVGDIRLAENFLAQARGLAPDDYKVQTAWAYMSLKRAAMDAEMGVTSSRDRAEEALRELYDAIERRGATDSYPYHVLGSQALSWLRRAHLTQDERRRRLAEVLHTVQEGHKQHPRVRELAKLSDDLEREYLMTSASGASGEGG